MACLVNYKMAILAAVILGAINLNQLGYGEPQVPCFFIFGDSLSDPGNNNLLATFAKANFLPYGIDFLDGPSGRFCNGKTTIDIITQYLGFERFIQPYNNPFKRDIMEGINYASASAGILDESGKQFGQRVSMDAQLRNHQNIILRINSLIGNNNNNNKTQYLNKCLYSVWMGSNDLGSYYLPKFSVRYTQQQFVHILMEKYSKQLKRLYDLGARKVVVMGLWPVGCTPAALALPGRCVFDEDQFSKSFNVALRDVLDQLNNKLHEAKFIFIDTYNIFLDNYNGFRVKTVGCCGDGQCHPFQVPCPNRDDYVFFDFVHTTESMNRFLGKRAYSAKKLTDASPFDIKHLVQL